MDNGIVDSAVRLLVVDDDQAVQLLMKAIFRRRDVAVECTGDGHAALRLLRRRHYHVLVLDLMIPGPNGFDIIREIKHRDRAVLDRTIVLTALSDHTLRDFADGKLVRRVMRKPFDLDELVGEVLALTPSADPRIALPHDQHAH
ncbi:MAG TPA: response regulator [Thermoanaerobaculia bacterium]|nr:response regulator [Thermoanaerobaculia bacterium]